jgi:RNA polymerase sigma factor (sigma-70 family)
VAAYEGQMAVDVLLLVRAQAVPTLAQAERRVSFEDLVRGHQDEVYGLALRILGDRDVALEVANTTFLKAYRAFDRYDPARPLRHWLLRIAANEAISAGRRITRERARSAGPDAALTVADAQPGPDSVAIGREDAAAIRAAVLALPELYRVPVVLRYFNDLAVEEIARVTGRPASTVGVQLLRARALLRSALEGLT